jgi:hypothetical protein
MSQAPRLPKGSFWGSRDDEIIALRKRLDEMWTDMEVMRALASLPGYPVEMLRKKLVERMGHYAKEPV